jgi:hypothetical protein
MPALAQAEITNTEEYERSTGGWIYGLAVIFAVLAVLTVAFLVIMYMRYAPSFSRHEGSVNVVFADRVEPGKEPPRRAVDLSQAVPIVVQPPALPAAVAAQATAAPALEAPATTAPALEAPATTAPAAAEAPAATAPAAAPGPVAPAEAPPEAPAPAAAPAVTPAPAPAAPAPAEARPEVSLDQEVFDATLAELLEKGTDRRVAEGQARRAAMIAARKKAAGEG